MNFDQASPNPLTPISPPAIRPAPPQHMTSQEWRYEMRREAQQIIPGLYLGPFQSSLNLGRMNSLGITHVLCIRDRKEASLIFPRFPTEFRYLVLDLSDSIDQNIISIFPPAKAFIEEALSCGGVVLAHCNGGIATAPAIVIGYLMWKFNWSYDYALAFVQSKRYCVSPMSFQIQLKEYEPIYLAQKQMELVGTMNQQRSKRMMADDEDERTDYKRVQPPQSNYGNMDTS